VKKRTDPQKGFKVAEETIPNPGFSLPDQLFPYLKRFAVSVYEKLSVPNPGEPEEQLRTPFEKLFDAYARIISSPLKIVGEKILHERLGKPDFAIYKDRAIVGYIELKAPGKGANPDSFKGHDREQWIRFREVPNIIYTDGNEWTLYQTGELVGKRLRLQDDIQTARADAGADAVNEEDARFLFEIFAGFSS